MADQTHPVEIPRVVDGRFLRYAQRPSRLLEMLRWWRDNYPNVSPTDESGEGWEIYAYLLDPIQEKLIFPAIAPGGSSEPKRYTGVNKHPLVEVKTNSGNAGFWARIRLWSAPDDKARPARLEFCLSTVERRAYGKRGDPRKAWHEAVARHFEDRPDQAERLTHALYDLEQAGLQGGVGNDVANWERFRTWFGPRDRAPNGRKWEALTCTLTGPSLDFEALLESLDQYPHQLDLHDWLNKEVLDALRNFLALMPEGTGAASSTLSPAPLTPGPTGLQRTLAMASNLILEGVPGTGKTYAIGHEICEAWKDAGGDVLGGRGEGPWAITLHPATSYEDFVEGLRPVQQGSVGGDGQPGPAFEKAKAVKSYSKNASGEILGGDTALRRERYFHIQLPGIHFDTPSAGFAMQDGFFLRVCAHAVNHPKEHFVVLLDEINRCNVPKVLGDLLTTIERSKRARWLEDEDHWDLGDCQVVTLPGSKRLFFVPDNVFVVATMNTTDRSVAPLDAALRRRFAFHRCWPMGFGEQSGADTVAVDDVVARFLEEAGTGDELREVLKPSVRAWAEINQLLSKHGGPDAMLGHSYLFDLAGDLERTPEDAEALLQHHWNHHILPQLVDAIVSNNLEQLLKSTASEHLLLEVGAWRIALPAGEAGRRNQAPVLRLVASSGEGETS